MTPAVAGRHVQIDFLYLDLEVCARCRGTDANLAKALDAVQGDLEASGVEVSVRKTLVDSAEKALAAGFLTSPTVRVDGRDVALEFRESRCESEACACGAGGGDAIQCRVWVYQGREYTEAPVPMIVEAILSAVHGGSAPNRAAAPLDELPENLKRFFASKESKTGPSCCGTGEQETCCEPSQKEACCGASTNPPAGCGCR